MILKFSNYHIKVNRNYIIKRYVIFNIAYNDLEFFCYKDTMQYYYKPLYYCFIMINHHIQKPFS